jgi:ATP-dependent DNA helicase RecG
MSTLALDQILAAAAIGESDDWEFKAGKGGLPATLWDTYSAMANTDGGVIVLGVVERDSGYRAEGLTAEQLAKVKKALFDGANNKQVVNRNLIGAGDVSEPDIGGAKLLAVRVPSAKRVERPIHRGQNPFGNTFRRAHEGDYRLGDDQVRRMLADADPDGADQRILTGYTIADLHGETLRQYRNHFSSFNLNHPWHNLDDQRFLEALRGYRRDPATGAEGLTLAGALMFGTTLLLGQPGVAPNYFVDYREKLDPKVRWTDRLIPDGYWEGNLYQFYMRSWPKLTQDLKVPFRLDGPTRVNETEVHVAVREAIVNALVHSDYAVPGAVVVERYRDRFVIENPGTLLLPLQQVRRGGVSECRNKAVQVMFRMIGGGDQAGSGYARIQAGWQSQHWRAPALTTQTGPDRVILTMPMLSLIPEEATAALEGRFGAAYRALSPTEVMALVTAQVEDAVTNSRLQDLLEDHPDDIGRVLQGLVAKGFLAAEGKNRWTRYRLPGRESGLFAGPGDSSQNAADSSRLPGDSSHLDPKGEEFGRQWEELTALAAPVAKTGKAPATTIRATLLTLCAGRYLTLAQLAELLNRNPAGLRNRHIAELERAGSLRLKYPHARNRPDQAYIATEEIRA